MSKELEALNRIFNGMSNNVGYIKYFESIRQALTELEELKSWRDELNETIQDLISKAKYWEEKENKTDFEKGIARGYKTMLHQLLVGIDFDKEEMK